MRSRLVDLVGVAMGAAPDVVLEAFLEWVADEGLEPYPAQEEAFLELMGDRHVILATPTGSGKSLVAALLHFKAMCDQERSFYTSPTKALASEKFFWLCEQFSPENVGMMTGDVAINSAAPIICCTTEVLSNMALRGGADTQAPHVVLDEFHYYSDRDRGWAWQVPLICLPRTRLLMMSATLGDVSELSGRIEEQTQRPVAQVYSEQRPVPLDFDYRDTPLHETVESLLEENKAPVYVVLFTQRACAEQAQALTSARILSREEKREIQALIGDFRFDTPYGKEIRRFLSFGIGVHHAGLLPKYRLLVEQLSQQGLLKVICGTDTLGVGVNIPIRTVLLSGLAKFDGKKVSILKGRDFRQISGRAGRKGFDEKGSVVCQAPLHLIEKKRAEQRAANRSGGRKRGRVRAKAPRDGVSWNQDTFQRLIYGSIETLESSFTVTHGMLVQLLQRDPDGDARSGYRAVAELINACHERASVQLRLRRRAAQIFRSLRRAGIVEVYREASGRPFRVRVSTDLQRDFSLNHALSLYLVDAIHVLDAAEDDYALDVLTLVEAILENPVPILLAQQDRIKRELVAELKAARVPYEERMRQLGEVSYPKPNQEFIYATFDHFVGMHPWLAHSNIHPKSIAREMVERYSDFDSYVMEYRIARIEGRLLRYLGDVYRTLVQNVPEFARTPGLEEVIAFLRLRIQGVDQSLLEEWETLADPASREKVRAERSALRQDLLGDEAARTARIRSESHGFLQRLAEQRYLDAADALHPDSSLNAREIETALRPFLAEHGSLRFDHQARLSEHTQISASGPQRWTLLQLMLSSDGATGWAFEAEIDLSDDPVGTGPLLRLRQISG